MSDDHDDLHRRIEDQLHLLAWQSEMGLIEPSRPASHDPSWVGRRSVDGPTRVVSVVTAVAADTADPVFLADLWTTIRDQDLPEGWELEWVVQLDGGRDRDLPLPAEARADPQVRPAATRRWAGLAATRNAALARTSGELVRAVDADDQLTTLALADPIRILAADPGIGWTVAPVFELGEDRRLRVGPDHLEPGRLPAGDTMAGWLTHPAVLTVAPETLTVRRNLLVQVGGWPAIPAEVDLGLLAAVDGAAEGYLVRHHGLIRRAHPGQMSRTAGYGDRVEAAHTLIAETYRTRFSGI